jgi:hypothetical protein
MDAKKLQCMTTAQWLMGYASTLDEFKHSALIHKMNQDAGLLMDVWEEYTKELDDEQH